MRLGFYFKKHNFFPEMKFESEISSCTQCSITFKAITASKQTNTDVWILHSNTVGMKCILHKILRIFFCKLFFSPFFSAKALIKSMKNNTLRKVLDEIVDFD